MQRETPSQRSPPDRPPQPSRPSLDDEVRLPPGAEFEDWMDREGRPTPHWAEETEERTWNPG